MTINRNGLPMQPSTVLTAKQFNDLKTLSKSVTRAKKELGEELDRVAPKRKRKHLEADLQRACFTHFRTQYPKYANLYFSIPNGTNLHKKRNAKGGFYTEMNLLKQQGLVVGVWDSFLALPKGKWGGAFFEFKIAPNKLSENQLQFLSLCQENYFMRTIFNFDDFKSFIEEYLR